MLKIQDSVIADECMTSSQSNTAKGHMMLASDIY